VALGKTPSNASRSSSWRWDVNRADSAGVQSEFASEAPEAFFGGATSEIKETTYNFAGPAVTDSKVSCVNQTSIFFMVIVSIAVGFLFFMLSAAAPAAPMTMHSSTAWFDCKTGLETWQRGWSIDKKAWCCDHAGVGCPPYPPVPTAALARPPGAPPFDCGAGLKEWRLGWSPGKRAWCCANSGKGCGRRLQAEGGIEDAKP